MPQRNDPCPCGSGKKYKHCCLAKDAAVRPELRLLRGAGADTNAIARSIGNQPVPLTWQADAVPLPTSIGNDPAARPVIIMVVAGDLILHAEIENHLSADAVSVAERLAAAVDAASGATGRAPRILEVRRDALAAPLHRILAGRGIEVRTSFALDALDAAVADLHSHMGVPAAPRGGPRPSHTETWAGWGLDAAQIGRLFGACAGYYRAAPWEHVVNDDIFRVKVTGGSSWSATVMGNAGEVYGLAMYADAADLDLLLRGDIDQPGETMGRMRGAVLSLSFDRRDEVPKRMRQEVRDARWEVAGPSAWPGLFVLNTPGGGITERQMDDLIAVVAAVPRFTAKYEAVLAGEKPGRFPLRWRDAANKVSVVFETSEELIRQGISHTATALPKELEIEVVRAMLDRHYHEWIDIPVPALGNRTPRHAVRLKTVRPVLIELLKAIERPVEDAGPGAMPAYDTGWMWKELGLKRER